MDTMNAMVLHEWGGELRPETLPIPRPGPSEVLLKVRACGVGYTISNIRRGRLAGTPNAGVPRILGNEVVGQVVATGAHVPDQLVGQRGMTYFYLTCGACPMCRRGVHDPLCQDLRGLVGVAVDGGFAEYMTLPAGNLVPLPDAVGDVAGAVTADAIATPWHALHRVAPADHSSTVVVVGAGGGVGVHAVQVAKLQGARVVALDVTREKLDLALQHGADAGVEGTSDDVIGQVREATEGRGADVVLDYVANEQTVHDAYEYLTPRGKLVVQGVNPPGVELRVEPRRFITNEVVVTGARHASRTELIEAADLVARGDIEAVVTRTMRLEQVEELFAMMDDRALLGRAAITFDD